MNIKQKEIAEVLGRTDACISLKMNGTIPFYVDEIQKLYYVYGDQAWEIYEVAKANREERQRLKHDKF